MQSARTSLAVELMTGFAKRTGLIGDQASRRYLWTDAFAVCNLLGLKRATGRGLYADLALGLVEQVHHELGRHRADDRRSGWIGGLPDDEGEAHPTRGGLRIGKPMQERAANEPLDPDLEWDRDGQYFHYLTKWMYALDQMTRSTGQSTFTMWARELAVVAHHAFTYGPHGAKRMVWKLSIDLSRPLVPSMGQHDPLDGFVTCMQLEGTADELQVAHRPSLASATADFAEMLDQGALTTSDPLGLGGLLVDVFRLTQLGQGNHSLVATLLSAAEAGLRHYVTQSDLHAPASRRLGFRELGLAIGLASIPMLEGAWLHRLDDAGRDNVARLARYVPLGAEIESFWCRPEHRRTSTWVEHRDINDVMLATCLMPDGFLTLASPRRAGGAATTALQAIEEAHGVDWVPPPDAMIPSTPGHACCKTRVMILDPLTFRNGIRAPNRTWLAPMTNQQSGEDGALSDDEFAWLEMRARGGFGVVETCAAHVAKDGQGWPGELGVYDDHLFPGLERLATMIRERGALGIVQLFHGGQRAPSSITGEQPWSATAGVAPGAERSRAATTEDIQRVIAQFRDAAVRTHSAGFAGVELHGAHGYLLCQFLSAMNTRTDGWGGSLEGRARLARETMRAVRSAVPEQFVVGVRLSPEDHGNARGLDLDESIQVARWLCDDGADFIHLSLWDGRNNTKKRPTEHAIPLFRAALPRDVVIVVAGGVWTSSDAETLLDKGASAVALGRVAIGNPDWPSRAADQRWESRRPPFSLAELRERGLNAKFAEYMRNWQGFVA